MTRREQTRPRNCFHVQRAVREQDRNQPRQEIAFPPGGCATGGFAAIALTDALVDLFESISAAYDIGLTQQVFSVSPVPDGDFKERWCDQERARC